MFRPFILAAALLSPALACANQQQADECAAGLSDESKVIYDAVAPQAATSNDLRETITTTTKSLVISGKVSRGSARASAEAAGQCVIKLRS